MAHHPFHFKESVSDYLKAVMLSVRCRTCEFDPRKNPALTFLLPWKASFSSSLHLPLPKPLPRIPS